MLQRVLMTTDTVGGVWPYAIELARALGGQGVAVALATMGTALTRSQCRDVAGIRRLQVYESEYRLEWMPDPWDDVDQAGAWLLELKAEVKPDVVHLNSYAHGVLPWDCPVLMVGHSCVRSWWNAVHGCDPPDEWDEYARRVQAGLRAADVVVAPSRFMLTELKRHYGPFRSSRVIANARDASRFGPAAKEPFVFSAGRLWDKAKNATALVEIAGEIAWPVYLAGPGEAGAGGGPRNVRFLGPLAEPEMAHWFSRASIYALPAFYEPFGLSVLEAALSGCALVLGDIPSLREIWGPAALYIPPADRGALRDALRDLIRHEDARHALARQARLRAERYQPARMGAAYWEAYCELTELDRLQEVAAG